MIIEIAKYHVFSTLDIRSAYHEAAIKTGDKIYDIVVACTSFVEFIFG